MNAVPTAAHTVASPGTQSSKPRVSDDAEQYEAVRIETLFRHCKFTDHAEKYLIGANRSPLFFWRAKDDQKFQKLVHKGELKQASNMLRKDIQNGDSD